MEFRSLAAALAVVCVLGGAAVSAEVPASSVVAPVGQRANVDPATAEAIAVVERFSTALAAGQIEEAATNLAPDLIVLESGGVEQDRAEYLGSHAGADAEFLKGAQITLKHRRAQASGDLAWVASASEIRAPQGAESMLVDATETMVLRKTVEGWKIVHIHWSSRRVSGTPAKLPTPAAKADASRAAAPEIVVHKSPTCGCCEKWVEHLREEGFAAKVVDTDDLGTFKQSLEVSPEHSSCHTATVDGYFIEGHVPAADIRRLLTERPAVRGLAVPGMPAGSPGMELPSGHVDDYETLLIDHDGLATVFSRHGGS